MSNFSKKRTILSMLLVMPLLGWSQGTASSTKATENALAKVAKMDNPVVDIPSTDENQKLGDYYGANAKAILAYEWGYALVRMESIMREYVNVPNPKPATSYRAPLNQMGWATELPTAKDTDMPSANRDTYYMSAVVDLTEPYVVSVPDTHDRYYVINVFDMYQNLSAYIGRRETGTKAGNYAIVPPGWEGTLPTSINKTIHVKTPKVWLWGRLRIEQGEDTAPVIALQKDFKLQTLNEFKGGTSPNKTTNLPKMPTYPKTDPLAFYKQLAWAMTQNPVIDVDKALVGQFESIGLSPGKFDESVLNDIQKKALYDATLQAPLSIMASIKTSSYVKNGWNFVTKLSDFGWDYTLRSMIAGPYLGGNGAEEALYPVRYTDSEGNTLDGNNTYKIHFKEEPPVDAFWSLTLWNAKTKMFVDNPLNRYKMSPDIEGFKKNADGSFDITISNQQPENTDNWIPANKGPFYIILRLYQPQQIVLDENYDIPDVKKI
ncbi:DUF1254 domain-containing protein [Mangrovimonas sp. TPBH4]|uniref:DUF1254 domain-containing protein n=1 Tax=Mangrovimonas sp. TPBH4 TaxID=1645914 RepID=UPI0009E9B99F|nr:DUF1254 domain-containing protein [Mangrovimonas sp. TPBH4]